jgi:hypothetical protein
MSGVFQNINPLPPHPQASVSPQESKGEGNQSSAAGEGVGGPKGISGEKV